MSVEAKLIKINDRRFSKKSADATNHGVKKLGPTYSILLRGKAGFTRIQALTFLRTIKAQPKTKRTSPSLGKHQSSVTAGRIDPAQAEAFYQNLGRWKGPRAAPEVQTETRAYWLRSGREGATWLVQRLRPETHVEPLHAAGATLAALGEAALGPIIEGLAGQPAEDQGIALLRALGWMAEDPAMPRQPGDTLGLVILQFLNDDVADLREAAAGAALLLPPNRAARWLKSRLAVERDEDVLVTIREGLAGLGRGEV